MKTRKTVRWIASVAIGLLTVQTGYAEDLKPIAIAEVKHDGPVDFQIPSRPAESVSTATPCQHTRVSPRISRLGNIHNTNTPRIDPAALQLEMPRSLGRRQRGGIRPSPRDDSES